jgi:hypothetical protein
VLSIASRSHQNCIVDVKRPPYQLVVELRVTVLSYKASLVGIPPANFLITTMVAPKSWYAPEATTAHSLFDGYSLSISKPNVEEARVCFLTPDIGSPKCRRIASSLVT